MNSLLQSATVLRTIPQSISAEVREGDWTAYRRHSKSLAKADFAGNVGGLDNFRRQCALAYLGKKAQFFGGTCSKMVSSTFTPRFVADLGAINESRRFSRYPWLGRLINILAEMERDQSGISDPDNVVSIASVVK